MGIQVRPLLGCKPWDFVPMYQWPAMLREMAKQTLVRFRKVDILVNNAGALVVKPMVEQTEEEWDRVLDVNLKGVFLCCR
jgi:NAD(P)-dependent dehydrogenase (short-subunit alcohol dehydrogenase family)